MIAEVKIAALVLAGLLSCQSVEEKPQLQVQPAETVAEQVQQTELAPRVIYPGWLPLTCTAVLPPEDMGRVLVDEVPGHKKFPHTFTAYLPPHYDPEKQYDLLVFLGPAKGRQGDCVDKYQSTWYTEIFRFRTVFDHLILENRVRPFIMVEPDYLQWKELELNCTNVAKNIEEEFLPYVAEHYSTYAEDGSHASLVSAREHIAMGGCSMGGDYTLLGLMPQCMDVAAFFCPMSCTGNMMSVQKEILDAQREYPLHRLIYTVGGMEEFKMKQTAEHIEKMLSDMLTEDTYLTFELEGTHHHYSTWAAGLWNSLQYVFREDA